MSDNVNPTEVITQVVTESNLAVSTIKRATGLKTWHCLGLLFVVTFGAYFNALDNGLVDFDDAVVLDPSGAFGVAGIKHRIEDFRWRPLHALPDLLVSRPLTDLTHALDAALFADDYWGHHLSDVIYHFLACCFAYLAAAELLSSKSRGLAAAMVFALHPLQTESVAYIAGRRDVLYGMLSLASLYYWLRGSRTENRVKTGAAVALWVLAMTAKTAAITLPLLWLAATDILPTADETSSKKFKQHLDRNLKLYLGCAVMCIAAVMIPLIVQTGFSQRIRIPAEVFWYGGSPAIQWATEPRIVLHALKLILWPSLLSADYTLHVFEPSLSILEMRSFLALTGCVSLAVLAWALRKRNPHACFALFWIILAYAPMLHILPTPHNQEPFAEHWLYLPLFGWALLLGSLIGNAQRFSKAVAAGLGIILCLYAGRTVLRNRDWKDALTLWSRTVKSYPQCGRAQGILGMVHLMRGDMATAEPILLRAIELRPDDPRNLINLAVVYKRTRRFHDAEVTLLRAHGLPLVRRLQDQIDYNLDMLYVESGQFGKVRQPWLPETATDTVKMSSRSLNLAGRVAATRGDVRMAERLHIRALGRNPDSVAALYDLGALYFSQGRFELAALGFEKLIARHPSQLDARIQLGLSYAEIGSVARARAALDQALRQDPRSVEVWLAMSRFHLKRKKITQALAAARQAARLEKSPRTNRQLYAVYRGM